MFKSQNNSGGFTIDEFKDLCERFISEKIQWYFNPNVSFRYAAAERCSYDYIVSQLTRNGKLLVGIKTIDYEGGDPAHEDLYYEPSAFFETYEELEKYVQKEFDEATIEDQVNSYEQLSEYFNITVPENIKKSAMMHTHENLLVERNSIDAQIDILVEKMKNRGYYEGVQ